MHTKLKRGGQKFGVDRRKHGCGPVYRHQEYCCKIQDKERPCEYQKCEYKTCSSKRCTGNEMVQVDTDKGEVDKKKYKINNERNAECEGHKILNKSILVDRWSESEMAIGS